MRTSRLPLWFVFVGIVAVFVWSQLAVDHVRARSAARDAAVELREALSFSTAVLLLTLSSSTGGEDREGSVAAARSGAERALERVSTRPGLVELTNVGRSLIDLSREAAVEAPAGDRRLQLATRFEQHLGRKLGELEARATPPEFPVLGRVALATALAALFVAALLALYGRRRAQEAAVDLAPKLQLAESRLAELLEWTTLDGPEVLARLAQRVGAPLAALYGADGRLRFRAGQGAAADVLPASFPRARGRLEGADAEQAPFRPAWEGGARAATVLETFPIRGDLLVFAYGQFSVHEDASLGLAVFASRL